MNKTDVSVNLSMEYTTNNDKNSLLHLMFIIHNEEKIICEEHEDE